MSLLARERRPLDPAGELLGVRSLPKVSLHDHLEGALREQTILELGAELGLELPAGDPEDLAAWFLHRADAGSLVAYLESFWMTDAVMQTVPGLHRVAREYVLDLAADGVVYGEVRWAPEAKQRNELTLDEVVEAVQAGIEDGMAGATAGGRPIEVRQLLCAMRNGRRAREIAELALRHRDRGVVGFDIAGPETGYPAGAHRDAFDLLAHELFPVTVHAGEADGPASIAGALVDGRALRLGHGVRIAEDLGPRDELGPVARWVRDRRVALETSPTSNLHTGAVAAWGDTMADHPFERLRRLGFTVTVNTDNRLMSQTTLSHDLARLTQAFGYGLDEHERFQLDAARAAFVDHDVRTRIIERIRDGFAAARTRRRLSAYIPGLRG
ncbi:adenosine deaminase [Actinoplanes sp. NPDC089786]|uniref:adenosine deaminase n=1 Tax=Actinoplanes sp. NPDC089786 TaxID=3155185 RepID=UPI00343C21CE